MKRQNRFFIFHFNYIYSTGIIFSKNLNFYFFPSIKDIFNTNLWLKKKLRLDKNLQVLKFKNKFSKKV